MPQTKEELRTKNREYSRAYYQRHKEDKDFRKKRSELARKHYQINREKINARNKLYKENYRKNNLEKCRLQQLIYTKRSSQRLKEEVFSHYGNGYIGCVNCGETRLACLSIDHIKGRTEKEKNKTGLKGVAMYRWLKRNRYPKGYQVLCMNCQWIKRFENKEYNQWERRE